VNEFIDECRREWRRLGVPDAVANEMAADLTADLDEAAAEGGTPEDVLGNSAFDPRRFASAWAVARGVTGPPSPDVPTRRRPPVAIVLAVLAAVLALGAGLIVAAGTRGHSFSVAVHSAVAGPGQFRIFPPGGPQQVIPGPFGRAIVGVQAGGVEVHPLALLLLVVLGLGLGVLAVVCWTLWPGRNRGHRDRGPRTPNWS
jgi:hypothetical protein